MPPLANRERFEQLIISDLEPIFSAQYDRAIASPMRIPYSAFRGDLQQAMAEDMAKVFLASGGFLVNQLGIVVSQGVFQSSAEEWSLSAASELADGVVSTSRDLAQAAIDKSGGDPAALRDALALVFLSDSRLRNIAITEVTRSVSAGEHAIAIPFNQGMFGRRVEGERRRESNDEEQRHHLREQREEAEQEEEESKHKGGRGSRRTIRPGRTEEGDQLIAIWRIDPYSNVCEICEPLNGHSETVWRTVYPFGPPGHPRCACHLDWIEAAEFGRMAA